VNNYQRKRIVEAIEYEEHLNEWECEFINDLSNKDDNYELSENQNKTLNRISEKIARI
jgi:hypothetical protein